MNPKASFVIPCFNNAAWVSQSIQSCLKQSVKDIEVVVVDDCSTDGSREVIEYLAKKDVRIVPVFLTENHGRSYARNKGNDQAKAPVILVLDADDLAVKNRVRETLDIFENKNPDIVHGPFWELDEFGTVGSKVTVNHFDPEIARKSGLNGICHSTMAYRKGVSLNIRYDDQYGDIGLDDWKFQWDAQKLGYKFALCRKPLCYYRVTSDGISRNRDRSKVIELKEKYLGKV